MSKEAVRKGLAMNRMSREEAIFLAKRNIVDLIWKSANLEGINVTFAETYAIIEKASLQNVNIGDVSTILNLKHAWQLLFTSWDEAITLPFIEKIHYEVAKDEALAWGSLRTGIVSIGGTDYIPTIPKREEVVRTLDAFSMLSDDIHRPIDRMLWMMKAQLFWDGNKRTAMLIANKDLIEHGVGLLSIAVDQIEVFNSLLQRYYSYGEKEEIKNYLVSECISTIETNSQDR